MFNLTNTAKTVIPALALLACFSGHASVTPDRTGWCLTKVTNPSVSRCAITIPNCPIWRRAG
ncbi:hypothetical protein DZ11F48_14830 [Escherichia coli]